MRPVVCAPLLLPASATTLGALHFRAQHTLLHTTHEPWSGLTLLFLPPPSTQRCILQTPLPPPYPAPLCEATLIRPAKQQQTCKLATPTQNGQSHDSASPAVEV